ncbi:hypothetical protein NC652_004385 [Populus alba x Populus x berolinensis]|nr:hypothetical protein NC652_004385 [Populus alba x Populus x berolinensis]
MKNHCKIVLCFLFLCFSSPTNSTSLSSQSSSTHSISVQHCVDSERTALLQLKRDLLTAKPDSSFPQHPSSGSLLPSWKPNTNCCSWEGVACHHVSGHVTSLDLSSHKLSGTFNSTNLLHLPFLEKLNLSNNNFPSSPFPSRLDLISNLTYLNLSNSGFSGQVPLEISRLTKLVSLDLSTYRLDSSKLEKPNFVRLVKDLRSLRELHLDGVNISGSICESLNQLSLLSKLDLSRNNLSSMFPKSIMLLSNLKTLDLSSNTPLSGTLPEFPIGSKLEVLSLMFTSFSGEIPYSIGNLQFLIKLDLRNCSFSGLIPSSLASLNQLVDLDLSSNKFLGWIPFLPPLPSLEKLLLSQNRLSGVLQDFERAFLSPLSVVDLSMNNFEGHIPNSFLELQNLTELKLFSNNFSGAINLSMIKSIESLAFLQLSDNSQLTIAYSSNLKLPQLQTLWFDSCNVSRIPSFLRNQDGLVELGLSNNKIQGILPKWISSVNLLSLSKNKFTGKLPVSFCNMNSLAILDISYNHLTGQIPQCLGNLSSALTVVNLRENQFSGSMLWNFTEECSLTTLNLYRNQLKGEIPASLGNCRGLKVLDLGDNQINDTFPFWLGKLPNLQVLILQSNRLHGSIGQPLTPNDFPKLHILDLSSNYFTGNLPSDYIGIWQSMKMKLNEKFLYMGGFYYRDWMTITNKGQRMENIHILTIFTVLDLSNNRFEGEIPEMIGDLKLLQVLNLSRNNLVGEIPTSLSKLAKLESLDLSQNKLTGEIPMQLTDLTFLSVFNLSYNRLVGRIPVANQFLTFTNDSYGGNLGLCGFPLSRKCRHLENDPSGKQQEDSGKKGTPFSWIFALVGYGVGMLLGLVIGYMLFWRTTRCSRWIELFFKAKKW